MAAIAEAQSTLLAAIRESREAIVFTENGTFFTAVAFSPDGRQIVTGSKDGLVTIWSADTGEQLAILKGHSDSVLSAEFSPNGQRIATASKDATARIWDAADGRELITIRAPAGFESAKFSRDGRHLTTTSLAKVQLWDVTTGHEVGNPRQNGTGKATVSWDDHYAVTILDNHKSMPPMFATARARVWNLATGKTLAEFGRDVVSAAFNFDGTSVVTASNYKSRTASIWEVKKKEKKFVSSAATLRV